MKPYAVKKNDQWAIKAFSGLALNEFIAAKLMLARIEGDIRSAENAHKAIRTILAGK